MRFWYFKSVANYGGYFVIIEKLFCLFLRKKKTEVVGTNIRIVFGQFSI